MPLAAVVSRLAIIGQIEHVQLSGFVSSRADIKGAVRVATAVGGVKSVTNDMQLK